MKDFNIPLSVPKDKRSEYEKNYKLLTAGSGNLFLIAGDQKVEHLNDDFFGAGISPEDNDPEHLFRIASASEGGVLATHLGLIARYGQSYWNIPYIVKINGKTNLGPNDEKDSSKTFWKVKDVVNFKKNSGLKIVGIGYTLYLGGKNEGQMLSKAARAIFDAHEQGLTAILWVYPRAKNVKEEDVHTIAGGAGVAASLNADFVKVKYPYGAKDKKIAAKKFQEVTCAAGKTRVVCVGGSKQKAQDLIEFTSLQLSISNSKGLAIGRNLHQRPLKEAEKLAKALSALILKGLDLKEALKIYNKKEVPTPEKQKTKFLGLF